MNEKLILDCFNVTFIQSSIYYENNLKKSRVTPLPYFECNGNIFPEYFIYNSFEVDENSQRSLCFNITGTTIGGHSSNPNLEERVFVHFELNQTGN